MMCWNYSALWLAFLLVAVALGAVQGWGSARLCYHWTDKVMTVAGYITGWLFGAAILWAIAWVFGRLA